MNNALFEELKGFHWAFHYNCATGRVTIRSCSLLDEVIGGNRSSVSQPVMHCFEGVSNITISTQDNLVIGMCSGLSVETSPERIHRCRIVIEAIDDEALIEFEFSSHHTENPASAFPFE